MKKICLGLAAVLLAGAAAVTGASAQNLEKFRVVKANANLNIGEDVFMMAVPKHLGYFQEEGLDVELLPAQGGAQAGQILITKGAEVASLLGEALLKIREQGGDVVGFYTLKQSNGYSVGVLPDSPIKTLNDLPGKKIGLGTVGAGSDALLAYQMKTLGIDGAYVPVGLGYGPQVQTAAASGQVDGLIFWDSLFAIFANQGLKMRHIEIPIQTELAGFQLAFRSEYAKDNEKQIVGYCRAMAKAYQFTRTNPQAAVEIFYKEFPSTVPAGKPHDQVISDGMNILKSWVDSSLAGEPEDKLPGTEYKERWERSQVVYKDLGVLTKDNDVSQAFTTAYYDKCNDFDRDAVIAQAKAYK